MTRFKDFSSGLTRLVIAGIMTAVMLYSSEAFTGVPFQLGADIVPGSALDVSFLLHRPAGAHGVAKADGERLLFSDGTLAFFWGVNMCWDALYPSESEGIEVARRLSVSGCNMVRMMYIDGGSKSSFQQDVANSTTLDTNRMERLDGFFAALKENGVYALLQLSWGRRTVRPDDGCPEWAISSNATTAKAALLIGRFFDARIEASDQKVWRTLLEHRNPYTGLSWANDPAIAAIEILNESSPYYLYKTFENIPSPLRDIIQAQWNKWLTSRYRGGRSALENPWGVAALSKDEDAQKGTVALDFSLLTASGITNPNTVARSADWNRFLAEISKAYYERQIKFLRELGCKQLIACTGGGSFSLADKWANRVGDLFTQHGYHAHPTLGHATSTCKVCQKNFGTNIAGVGTLYENNSLIKNDMKLIQYFASGRPGGMPFGISEWDFCWPNEWRAEGWAPMAAYARLQGWSVMTAFAYNSRSWSNRSESYSSQGDMSLWKWHNDPTAFGQWPLTALIFLRGDVQPAKKTIDVGFSDDDVFMREKLNWPDNPVPFLSNVSLSYRMRQIYYQGQYTGSHRMVPSGRTAPEMVRGDIADIAPALKDGWIESDTGEIRYRAEPGIFVIDTPRTQGVSGFFDHTTIETSALRISMQSSFASVMVSSLDGKPIRHSRRMLVTAVGRCQNTDFAHQRHSGKDFIYTPSSQGRGPVLIEPIQFTMRIQSPDPTKQKIFALDGSGARVSQLQTDEKDGAVSFRAGKGPATIYYEITQ